MKLSNDRDWLMRMAALEDNCSTSVGGLVVHLSDELMEISELHGDKPQEQE